MRRRNPQLNWDRLLDGSTYTLTLDEIGWETSLNDLRAKAHYEADKRRGIVITHKIDALTLEVQGKGVRSKPVLPCSCGTPPWDGHVITCTALGANATPVIGRPRPARPAPQEQPPTMTVEPDASQLTEADMEALLGPCSCGQSPICQPSCSRFG
jgi:hypothetical protein